MNELTPAVLRLTQSARMEWIRYYNQNEKELGPGGPRSAIRGLANKLPEHAVRIAGVLSVIEEPSTNEISLEFMKAGITLAEHYAGEALRLFEVGLADPVLREAERLRLWILNRDEPLIALVQIYRFGPTSVRDKQSAKKLVKVLEDHGWLEREPDGAEIDGVKRREVWRVRR